MTPHRLVALLSVPAALSLIVACQVTDYGELPHNNPNLPGVAGVLLGRHQQVACEACHTDGGPPFAPVSNVCLDCHAQDRSQHFLGEQHEPNAQTCGGAGCHAVTHYCWGEVYGKICENGPQPTIPTEPTEPTEPTTPTEPTVPTGNSCAGKCHGPATRPDASPADGSHNAHLSASTLWAPAQPVGCETCHPYAASDVVLASSTDTAADTGAVTGPPQHENGVIDVSLDGPSPGPTPDPPAAYNGTTCSNTYCHGGTLADAVAEPVWNGGRAEAACGACHAVSPGAPAEYLDATGARRPHPAIATCSGCHSPTGGNGNVIEDAASHIDGYTTPYRTP